MNDDFRDSYEAIGKFMREGESLVNALNASTGYTPENPNPLTARMSRLIKEMKEERGESNG